MATFVGTKDEFHRFIGPRIRNAVNLFARKGRVSRQGVCEHCETPDQILDSAHTTGRGRRHFIDEVIDRYTSGDTVRCSIEVVENEIIVAHGDVTTAFKFLCKPCHRAYDTIAPPIVIEDAASAQTLPLHARHTSRLRLTFVPANEIDFKNDLIKYKKAKVTTITHDGRHETRIWTANNFSAQSNLRGNLASGYFRDWQSRGIAGGRIEIIYE